ncbi:MAG: AAA family ATPase [Candidatus Jordarchaeaceae archaeon]
MQEIKKWILFCPEGRLQEYKGKNFTEYIRKKGFSGAEKRQLIGFIAKIDPKIYDYKYEDLIRRIGEEYIKVTIAEQGSGIRSLVCLFVDLLAAKDSKILLIDEPELGLNPFKTGIFEIFIRSCRR